MTRPVPLAGLFAALASAAVLLTPAPGTAQTGSLNIEIDQAQRVQLRGPAGSVIVGNPAIADVTVVDSNTLYITGKGYGVTEIVAPSVDVGGTEVIATVGGEFDTAYVAVTVVAPASLSVTRRVTVKRPWFA